ncbi:hypothetical protein MOPEL_060_00200 [Mobilicoccus pelagius NBRC 104925]|uniref:Uncharacterized protein n=1 Tax=Mobilicoccus pelagius NBRC 104925 TaxID=1089455 RepID=H5UQU6_9MICO|nr:hypothetical protein MOPEL_060_00200 [Mobilicoccus pelagius NBRC 104925]
MAAARSPGTFGAGNAVLGEDTGTGVTRTGHDRGRGRGRGRGHRAGGRKSWLVGASVGADPGLHTRGRWIGVRVHPPPTGSHPPRFPRRRGTAGTPSGADKDGRMATQRGTVQDTDPEVADVVATHG